MSSAAAIPAGSRKVVQSLKEIVNYPELEIYAMLKECNMDPNDTVQRLLSQASFREVKSKRERRKEVKETLESRSRGIGSGSDRGVSEVTMDRTGQTLISTSEPVKSSYKRENGSVVPPLLSSTSRTTVNQVPQSYMSHSDFISGTNKGQSINTADVLHSSAQPSLGSQPAWSGARGHVSMADIVKMGNPQCKASGTPIMSTETIYLPSGAVVSNSSSRSVTHPHEFSHSQNPISNVIEIEPGTTVGQHVHHEDWPVIEQSKAASSAADTEIYSYPSSSHSSRANLSYKGRPEDLVQASEDVPVRNLSTEHNGSTSASGRQTVTESAWGASNLDCDSIKGMSSCHSHQYTFEHQEGIAGGSKSSVPNFSAPLTDDLNTAVSSTTANFEQLSLGNEDLKVLPVDDNHAVVIPNHLQVSAADCSHLSFGTFKSGNGLEFSGSLSSNPIKSDLEEATSAAIDGSSASHLDTSTREYHGNEQLISMSDPHSVNVDRQTYESSITSQQGSMKPIIPESTQLHHVFPSSLPGYDIENRQQLRSTLSYAQSNPHIMDTSTFPSGMVLKSGAYSVPQPNSGTGSAAGPTFPQNFPKHSYSQPSIPMGHSANMSGYPILPQSYGYLPSVTQQAYPGSSSLQSLAALESAGLKYTLPRYRSIASVGSPQSAVNASGYGNFGSSTHAGSFLQKPSSTPTYDDILSSLYKDGNQYHSLKQNETSTTSSYGPGPRTFSSVPGSVYYDLQGQNQQLAGYRQGQQTTQHYEGLEYSNYLQPQSGIIQDQRQNAGDLTSNGIQGPSSKQSQQFWQHNY